MIGVSFEAVIAICLLITFLVCFILSRFKKVKHNTILKVFFCITYLFLIFLFLFKPYIFNGIGKVPSEVSIMNLSLKPFKTISTYLSDKNYIYALGNIIIIVPLFPLGYFSLKKYLSYKSCFFILIIFVFLIEPIQLLINLITQYPNKVVDIDDFVLNLVGYIVGFILTIIGSKIILKLHKNINLVK